MLLEFISDVFSNPQKPVCFCFFTFSRRLIRIITIEAHHRGSCRGGHLERRRNSEASGGPKKKTQTYYICGFWIFLLGFADLFGGFADLLVGFNGVLMVFLVVWIVVLLWFPRLVVDEKIPWIWKQILLWTTDWYASNTSLGTQMIGTSTRKWKESVNMHLCQERPHDMKQI